MRLAAGEQQRAARFWAQQKPQPRIPCSQHIDGAAQPLLPSPGSADTLASTSSGAAASEHPLCPARALCARTDAR